jgi:hypothetical protein
LKKRNNKKQDKIYRILDLKKLIKYARLRGSKMVHRFVLKISILKELAIASGIVVIPLNIALADTSSADYIFLIDSNQQSCQQIGEGYQDIRTFETNSFYINICQKDNDYYYIGEAKTGNIDTIFLPANALAPGEMYRANNGNVAYIVTILANEAILTVERNGAQVAIENSLAPQCTNSQGILQIPREIASQMYYPMNDAKLISDRSYLELNPLETIDLRHFDEFNSLAEYNPEAILNVPSCDYKNN